MAKKNGTLYVGHIVPDEPDPFIYSCVHVYQREGEPESMVRTNAMRERKMHGPATLVFQHLHPFGAACEDGCRAKVEEEE